MRGKEFQRLAQELQHSSVQCQERASNRSSIDRIHTHEDALNHNIMADNRRHHLQTLNYHTVKLMLIKCGSQAQADDCPRQSRLWRRCLDGNIPYISKFHRKGQDTAIHIAKFDLFTIFARHLDLVFFRG